MTDVEALEVVTQAFRSCVRPEHFTNFEHCEECAEHDEALRSRDIESLAIEDVGNAGWDPMCFVSPQGFVYYLPALTNTVRQMTHCGPFKSGADMKSHSKFAMQQSPTNSSNTFTSFTRPHNRSALVRRFMRSVIANQERHLKIISSALALLLVSVAAYAETPLEEVKKSNIEYPSPKAAYEALSKKEGVNMRTEANGWVIASDRNASAIWSFPPATDPSFPSVVKRTIVESPEGISIKMDVKCGGSKEACDNLVRQFLELNERMKQEIKSKSESKK